MRFASLLVLPFAAFGLAHGQIVIGGKKFERSLPESGAKGEWVLYEKGAPQNAGTRRWLTKRVLVELQPGKTAAELKTVAGVVKSESRGKYAVVDFAGGPDVAIDGAAKLKKVAGVRAAEPMLARRWFPFFTPNDPLFDYSASSPGYQWHLKYNYVPLEDQTIRHDLNVTSTWDTYKGAGIRIGIVDDGLEVSHPDLTGNVDRDINGALQNHHDFNDGDDDPSPGAEDFHGTSCAGVAAAKGNNGIGVTGVAPEATLVGLRLIAEPTTDAEDADAMSFKSDIIQVKSNSWGPFDDARGAHGPGPLAAAAIKDAATTGRGGKGSVFLWAAGNGNYSGDDSNYDGWANSPDVIAVSAINEKARASWYSEPGANILVCAPSNGGKLGITTTDRTGATGYNEDGGLVEYPDFTNTDYTNTFGGTSSATPAVAGVVALMLQANADLTARDVREILVRTAVKNDFFDGGWVQNGAGFHFNPNYGAGLVDADAATAMAATWTNVAPVQRRTFTQKSINAPIPDADEAGVSRTFPVSLADNLRLEHVLVHVKATHPRMGDLEWRLTSPSGVKVRLARARYNDDSANLDWTFMTTNFWGERSHGDWKLEVFDRTIDRTGTLDEVTLTFLGTPTSLALPLPMLTSSWIIVGREDWEMKHQMTASNFATSFDADRVFTGLPTGLSLNPTTGLITGTPTETGLTEGYQYATNTTGTNYEYTWYYILAATPALSTAVEQPSSTKIIPFGFGDPISQTTVTQDGVDAIATAPVGDEEYSGIEFTVPGPARLTFKWKVSSEKNADYLIFNADNKLLDYISGEVDWKTATADFGPGPHNVDIYYTKDPATAKGQDKGWIDEMTITPITTAPVITAETVHASQATYFTHEIEATNAPSSFTADNLPAGLSLHATTGLLFGSVAAVGVYPVTVHVTNIFGTSTAVITVQVGSIEEGLAAAIDAPAQTVTSSGDLPWIPQQVYSTDGEDAARSGAIGNLQSSTMSTQIIGPCKVTFYWAVSSEEDYDFFRFSIDGVEKDAISGGTPWLRAAWILPAGTHTLTWTYQKDDFTAAGLDSGFVDRLATHHDNDGDGIYSDEETWFGTSDSNPSDFPRTDIARGGSGTTLTFPSIVNQDYRIEYSDDLTKWAAIFVTATGTTTTWTDLNAANKPRRFYRVVIP